VSRSYKSNPLVVDGRAATGIAELLKALNRIVEVRGAHVHRRQYDDDDLGRMTLLELLLECDAEFAHESGMSVLYSGAVRKVRRRLLTTVGAWNELIEGVLDMYCDILWVIVFDTRGRWILPDKLRTQK
jgi:hypothetical protein